MLCCSNKQQYALKGCVVCAAQRPCGSDALSCVLAFLLGMQAYGMENDSADLG